MFSRRLHVTLVFCICCWSYLETNFDVLGDISISDNAQNHETMQDTSANIALFFLLLGSEIVTLANLVKAAILESLTENEDAENIAGLCEITIDCVLMWIPLAVCLLHLIVHLWRQTRKNKKNELTKMKLRLIGTKRRNTEYF